MRAVCLRCGASREHYDRICPSCGHQPAGDGLLVAWLLSDANLSEAELDGVAERVRKGESVHPSRRMLRRARRALGADFSTDPGLSVGQRLALLATSLLITPLVGWVLAIWWREQKPRAALQALALSLPASVLFFGLGLWLWLAPVFA